MSHDPIQHPQHYCQGKIEVLDFIIDQKLDYCEGNVIKYVCRYKYKGAPLEDLRKARTYLDRLIARHSGPARLTPASPSPAPPVRP